MEEKRVRQFCVCVNENNMRLDEYLSLKIGRMSRSQAQNIIKSGAVAIEPFRAPKPSLKVHTDDIVSMTQTLVGDIPMYDEVRLLDETDDFWVFEKPAGMAVHPTANIYHNTLTRYVETVLHASPFVVHRLDKETSGIILMAKSGQAGMQLGELFLRRDVEKRYQAVCLDTGHKFFPGYETSIEIGLGLSGVVLPRITMGPGELSARTDVCCLDTHGAFAWLELQLHSGRQHQIRAHLALTGTPIIGDKLYLYGEAFYKSYLDGEEVAGFIPHRQLLHATRLEFSFGGHRYRYESAAPEIFHAIFQSELNDRMIPTGYAKLF